MFYDILNKVHVRQLFPDSLKHCLRRILPYAEYRSRQLRLSAQKQLGGDIPSESAYESPYNIVLGILRDKSYTFVFNIAACRELQVRFKVIDPCDDGWRENISGSGCKAFLATPPTLLNKWRRIYEERLSVIESEMGYPCCPAWNELFFWNRKYRTYDWLKANNLPHPVTHVFRDYEQAVQFCKQTDWPLVCKTDGGASSGGVFIVKNIEQAKKLVRRAFGSGLLPRMSDFRNSEKGNILFQEYIPHSCEWRIMRIGDDYLCRRKIKIGRYASGSGDIGWAKPLPGMLDFVRRVTDTGGFRTMAVDMFENTVDSSVNPYLVNELQAIVGAIGNEENRNEFTGKWRHDILQNRWCFDPGFFYQNACANLRVERLLKTVGIHLVNKSGNK